jgi:hypothetical protein
MMLDGLPPERWFAQTDPVRVDLSGGRIMEARFVFARIN